MALALAIVAAVAVYFFVPPAGAAVTAIGSWIGGLYGFTGIAASNFGLALLGGGAVSAGGLGMAGGAAVLAAAFSFGTDIVLDFTTGQVIEKYQYEKFAEASRQMTTLPIPRNKEGLPAYEKAMEILAQAKESEGLSSRGNRAVILQAINAMEYMGHKKTPWRDAARYETMLGLLYFVVNDYSEARQHARTAYRYAQNGRIRRTLPAFLVAASSLYDEQVNFVETLDYFRYAIHGEPENPLTPVLFAVFLDRMMYRFNDGTLSVRQLSNVATVADWPALGEQWAPVQVIVLSRYVLLLKKEQQRISSLVVVGSSNPVIRDSERTFALVRQSIADYEQLLKDAEYRVGRLKNSKASSDAQLKEQVRKLGALVTGYSGDRSRLTKLVATLEARQAEYRQMLAQMKELTDYINRLEAGAKAVNSLAGPANAANWDNRATLTNAASALREYESTLERAKVVAGTLSSPKTLPDDQSDADVREAQSELIRYAVGLPTLQFLVGSLEAHQTALQANRMASAAQSLAKGEQTEAVRAQENIAEAGRRIAEMNRRRVIAVLMAVLFLALGIGVVRRRSLMRKPGS